MLLPLVIQVHEFELFEHVAFEKSEIRGGGAILGVEDLQVEQQVLWAVKNGIT
jgi:hypothetical protein